MSNSKVWWISVNFYYIFCNTSRTEYILFNQKSEKGNKNAHTFLEKRHFLKLCSVELLCLSNFARLLGVAEPDTNIEILRIQCCVSKSKYQRVGKQSGHYMAHTILPCSLLYSLLNINIFNKIKNLLQTTSILKPSELCIMAMVKIH